MELTVRSARTFAAFALAAAAAATVAADGRVAPAPKATARAELRAISTRLDGGLSTVLIEASEPVAYVTSQPDPLTVLVDLRNVRGGQLSGVVGPLPPVANVDVEEAVAGDGAPLARVRVSLAHTATHRVRSSRNLIYVEVERNAAPHDALAPQTSSMQEPAAAQPSTPAVAEPLPSTVSPAARAALASSPAAASAAAVVPPQPVAPAAAPAPTAPNQPAPQRFTGEPVTLDFQGADLRAVLRNFADISGLNIVIDPSIQGTVDVALKDVPWDQALDIILRANKLGYAVDGTVVRIAPLSVLAQEQDEQRKLSDAKALSGELGVVTLPLSYAKAPELVAILTRSALSSRGEVQVDNRTNTLIVRDLPDRLTTATELVRTLDRAQPQVEIEARIVQTTRNFAKQIGVQWGFNGRVDPALGNTTNLAFPNNGAVRGNLGGAGTGPGGSSTGVNLGAPSPTSAVGIALGAVNGALNLDLVLSQLEASGRLRILSTPRVSTQNNFEAEMTQGIQIPIQTVANNTVTVSFKDATLTLRVTPQITASNTVIMKVFLENGIADFGKAVNGIPPINTQRAVTNVLVSDGDTTVIGGIYISQEATKNGRVPLLHRVPLLGWLFQREELTDDSSELLIFITPRITKS